MFVYRGLLLAVTISSTSIVLADILVQPGYEHQYNTDPQYHQTFGVRDTTSQQFHDTYGASPSNLQLVSYPHHYYHHPYYHGYQHPSTYYHRTSIHHHQQAPSHYYTVTAHHRYKRSPDSTNAESNKTTIALRDAVPAISTLDSPLMTTIMPPHYFNKKTMDAINDKRVENFPSQNNHPFKLTGLLGLNPKNMLSKNRQIKSQEHESDEKQYLKQYSLPISINENNKLRQKKHHNQEIVHTPFVTDGSSKPIVGTVSTTKVCFNNTQRKNNITFSFALPSSNGLFYSLSQPVYVIQQTRDNYNSNTLDGNNILYYINTGTSSYLIPETYKSLNFRPFQKVSANYYPVSPKNIAPQRYAPSYVIPTTYTSPNIPSVRQISTYNYPVSPRCIAPRTYYSIYPLAYNNVPYVYQTFSSPAYY